MFIRPTPLGKLLILVAACFLLRPERLPAGEILATRDSETGWMVYSLTQGETKIRVVPQAGANAYSLQHRGVEYFRVPENLKQLPGVSYGNPILYPMPNRVRNGEFTFDGATYRFPTPQGGNFIHGLVNGEPFEVEGMTANAEEVTLVCRIDFVESTRRFELFPWKHVFRVRILVRDGRVSWQYEVENKDAKELPFGVAFHPYFIYQNSRKETYLRVPATQLMEATAQLPTGNLLSLDAHPLDARKGVSLAGYRADNVFVGMQQDHPASVEFRDVDRKIYFDASPEFTHLVIYTPDSPFFCVENQTCSTDAHNLAAQGKQEVAHLQLCPPGERRTGRVEYRIIAP